MMMMKMAFVCSCMVLYGLNLQFYDDINDVYRNPFKFKFSKVKVKEQPVEKGKVKLED